MNHVRGPILIKVHLGTIYQNCQKDILFSLIKLQGPPRLEYLGHSHEEPIPRQAEVTDNEKPEERSGKGSKKHKDATGATRHFCHLQLSSYISK